MTKGICISVVAFSRVEVNGELFQHIEERTARPTTAYQLVTRMLGYQLSAGVQNITVQGVVEDAFDVAKARKIKGITIDALYNALPHVVAALLSPDPKNNLQI